MLVRLAALLCLDEPTNHLDLASREVLEGALAAFPGTIVFISHDRYFINRIATSIAEITRGSLVVHQGNYDDYLAHRAATEAARAAGERDVRGGVAGLRDPTRPRPPPARPAPPPAPAAAAAGEAGEAGGGAEEGRGGGGRPGGG